MGKVVMHPSSHKVMVRTIMDEVRAVKTLRAIAKELRGHVHYSPEVAEKVLALKKQKETK